MPQRAGDHHRILSRTTERAGDIADEDVVQSLVGLLRIAAELLHRDGELEHVDPAWVDANVNLRGRSREHGRRS